MSILLAYISGAPDRSDPYLNLLPSGLCYLHAVLREAGHDSRLANVSAWKPDAIEQFLRANPPRMAGISQWTHNRHQSLKLARTIRRLAPECMIVMGGGHASFCYADILLDNAVDAVVLGEGEETLLELADLVSQGLDYRHVAGIAVHGDQGPVKTPSRTPRNNLDSLSVPARYLDTASYGIDRELQAEFILTARGCPWDCHFCSSPAFWGRTVRFRSPAAILDEMLFIRDHFGLIYFSMRDDTFTANRRRALDFCRMLADSGAGLLWNCQSSVRSLDMELLTAMKHAGCECIQLGVESGSPAVLEKLGKSITPQQVESVAAMIRAVGIHLSIYLISDLPGESARDHELTRSLIRRISPDDGYVSPLAYYPGTEIFHQAVATGDAPADLFLRSGEQALYAQPGRQGATRLLKTFSALPHNIPDFEAQKRLLGFCHTTSIMAGTRYEEDGRNSKAAAEYQEVCEKMPHSPWGWYLRGELLRRTGNHRESRLCYHRVLELVPHHGPSRQALGLKKTGP